MARSVVDFTTPAAGFDQPLELWNACHGRVRRMLALLQRLADHIDRSGIDGDARTTAVSIKRYFEQAAPHHHEDEERDLFPRLREKADQLDAANAAKLLDALRTLETDHTELAEIWSGLRVALTSIEHNKAAILDRPTIALFVSRYHAHMQIEETVIEPALKRLLRKGDLAAIGKAMAKRRGVDWNELKA
ncbi:MAG: hemerythrin domain-containing protein [Gemmatimonadota bacterium]